MAELKVLNKEGKEVEKIKIKDEIFKGEVNDYAIQMVVRNFMNGQRDGSATTKSRAMVKGSNKKIYRQKGTGNARMGRKRTSIRRGGGVAFAKVPRDFTIKVNKKIKKSALISALRTRLEDFIIIDSCKLENPKTKEVVNIKKNLNLPEKTLFVLKDNNEDFDRAVKNIEKTMWVTKDYINVYYLLYFDKIVFEKDAILELEKRIEL
ncbi:50S ribosomal protein L4 [bacterium]|nr:50S ribosomal protein L4 [bacterium]